MNIYLFLLIIKVIIIILESFQIKKKYFFHLNYFDVANYK